MDNTYTNICLYSFNSRGFGDDKQDICKLLMLKNDCTVPILCNQENFLLFNNRYKVKQTLPNCHILFKTAVMDSSYGRPKNGMFIAVPNEFRENILDVSPNHWRIQAIIINTMKSKILVINSYFPTDPKTRDFDTAELISTLKTVNDIITSNEFDHLIWAGDLNADFIRGTKFTLTIDSFIKDRGLLRSWDKFEIDFTRAVDVNGITFTSILDHFCWSVGIEDNVADANVLHLPQNLSDHCPIYCMIKVDGLNARPQVPLDAYKKPRWRNSSQEQKDYFRVKLANTVEDSVIPDCCKTCFNVHCNDKSHNIECDNFLMTLLRGMENVANECLTSCGGNNDKNVRRETTIAQWHEEIQPFKDKAIFWHAVWVSAGRPINTQLHNVMKRSRNVYHFQIRKYKKITKTLKRNTFLQACMEKRNIDLFQAIRSLRRSQPSVANTIDETSENIPGHFADIYSSLYNSVEDQQELLDIGHTLNTKIDAESIKEVEKITPSLIVDAVAHLKHGRNDPIFEFSSDCIKNAPPIFYEYLAIIFKSFLVHGHISSVLLLSTLIPIVKDKLGNICSSDNYRSIAISSLILKIFDWVIILLYGDKMSVDQLQFSYQPNISTNMCTWAAIETIDFFTRNGSEVFVCTMDMSKAFDKVKHSILFNKLISKGLPEIYVRLLLVMYQGQAANVRWNNELSKYFSISNGVKQGAVLSAILFCVYINDLYELLRKNRSGCWINDEYYGIIGYSDDILLLAPSIDALQEMLRTCENYACKHNMQFSTDVNPKKSKTKCMAFVKRKDVLLRRMNLCGNTLPWVNNIKHLGTLLSNDLNITADDVMQKRAAYINRNNELCQEFHFTHPNTKIKINKSFNSSFYGSVLWDLFGTESLRLDKTWNISLRKMLSLPRKSHRYFLEPISMTRHVILSLYTRFIKFTDNIRKCNKRAMVNLLNTIQYDCRSKTGSNLRQIMLKTGKMNVDNINLVDLQKLTYYETPSSSNWKINFVKELIDSKFGELKVPGFHRSEIEDILKHICTS